MTMNLATIQYNQDEDGLVTLTLDDPQQSANTMRQQFVEDYITIVDHIEANKADISGVLITSAKPTFFAGGDLRELIAATPDDAPIFVEFSNRFKRAMRILETLGMPVVAAINGVALGGGLEIALACHYRVASDNSSTRIGLPEVTLGLLPGGGGLVRTVRLLGVIEALTKVLIQGRQMGVPDAKTLGLIDEIAPNPEAMLSAAKAWIAENPKATQPWDAPGYKMPGGTPTHPMLAANLAAIPATLKSQTKGAHYDAPHHIMSAAVEGAAVDIDRAFEIETRYFVDLVCHSPQAKNMTQAFFFDLQSINKGGSRPDGFERWSATKVAVLGAGMMGAGIAYQCARSGIDVVLKDVSLAAAEKGKAYSENLVTKAVKRGKLSQNKADAHLLRITPTDSYDDLAGCDLVIEAVFESPDLKKQIFADTEPVVAADALLCSNTSTLPITDLATGVSRPQDFIGLHFFSPVDNMPLVEIIVGKETSETALAKAVDVVLQIGKTPIVVNDSRGFFTSRVIGGFVNEALAMLTEGINPVMIERAGNKAGYPAPPLQLIDELTLTLPAKIMAQNRAGAKAAGIEYVPHPAETAIEQMLAAGREGRSGGAGFYDYDESGNRQKLWPGLFEMFGIDDDRHLHAEDEDLLKDMSERMLFGEAIETVKCFDEGVITSYADANIGSIFGIGFPAWTGGVAQYIDQYPGGTTGFVARCKELSDRYGDRFTAPASLTAKADTGEPFRPKGAM